MMFLLFSECSITLFSFLKCKIYENVFNVKTIKYVINIIIIIYVILYFVVFNILYVIHNNNNNYYYLL